MADTEIAFLSIAELGARYRSGALSPTAVTEICLERIERLDGALNAVGGKPHRPSARSGREG